MIWWVVVAVVIFAYLVVDNKYIEPRTPRCPHCKRRYY